MVPFPVALDLADRDVLIVGADADVVARIPRLVRARARVLVLVREPPPEALCTLASDPNVHIEQRLAEPNDLRGKALTFVATTEEQQAPPLFERARAMGHLLCTVDRPEFCTFISPAVVQAGSLAITVSTGGASPALARRLREDLEKIFAEPRFQGWLRSLAEERAALPRGEKAARGAEAVRGFSLEGRLTLPNEHARAETSDVPLAPLAERPTARSTTE